MNVATVAFRTLSRDLYLIVFFYLFPCSFIFAVSHPSGNCRVGKNFCSADAHYWDISEEKIPTETNLNIVHENDEMDERYILIWLPV